MANVPAERKITQDPTSKILRALDWGDWLAPDDALKTSTWTIPDDLTLVSNSITPTLALFRITGGVDGVDYEATCKIVTENGDEDDKTVLIKVREG